MKSNTARRASAWVLKIVRSRSSHSSVAVTLIQRFGKKQANDADRLRKYLARFGLDWAGIAAGARD